MKMQKRQFRIGQLANLLGIERFVVRFWEKEFNLNAHRSTGGQRFYEEKDFNRFKQIKELLYEEGFTIAGAKKRLKDNNTEIIASQKTTFDTTPEKAIPHQLWLKNLKEIQSKLKTVKDKL